VYLRCCSLPTMDQPLPLAPGVAPTPFCKKSLKYKPTPSWASK
jgi:hypothetical protein